MTDPEVVAALLGAGVGVAGSLVVGIATWALAELSTNKRELRASRVALAREIIRNRGDQRLVAASLNEIPVVFSDDAELLRLYRQFLDGVRTDDALLDIVVRVSKVAKINANVTASDLKRFLSVEAKG
ncbi:hypothetical protein [Brevibacterium pigmentatum]|uniref:hypothetical protein n=1 Tax=Brevibacterium pigmentatum TaxID=1496080 RepID=UPI0014219D0D|nr:hypothetical protein [Brevibacterium pigmentatum]